MIGQRGHCIGRRCAELFDRQRVRRGRVRQPSMHFVGGQPSDTEIGHHRAMPDPSDHNAVVLQLAIGASDRIHCQAKVGGELSDGRKWRTRRQHAAADHRLDLSPDLLVRGHSRGGVDLDQHPGTATDAETGGLGGWTTNRAIATL